MKYFLMTSQLPGRKQLGYLTLAMLLLLAGCSPADNEFAAPQPSPDEDQGLGRTESAKVDNNFAHLLNTYPQARLSPTPWAGHWWPYTDNGIASSKYTEKKSPAARYDAAHGKKTQAQSWEASNHGAHVPHVEGWWGHCNGWCAAAALYPEPKTQSVVNGVSFSVLDIKALLTEAGMRASADYFGSPVVTPGDYQTGAYRDTVPNQVFLVLTHFIGKQNKAVLFDRYTGYQKWNQPLAGYKITYPTPADVIAPSAEAPNIHRIQVTMTLWYVNDNWISESESPPFNYEDSYDGVYVSRELKSELWLDGPITFDAQGKMVSSGNIVLTRDPSDTRYWVGGAWLMGDVENDGWPDYMWVPYAILPSDANDNNPFVDINWLTEHLLPPGGRDDPNFTGTSPDDPPSPSPAPSASPTHSPLPIPSIVPVPSHTPVPSPSPQVSPHP